MQVIQAQQCLTADGWQDDVAVTLDAAGRIAKVGPAGATVPDHRVDILLPAPVNLHSHAFQRAMAGLTEARGPDPADSFWTWRRLMFRFLDQLTPDDAEAIAALVYMEMLEAGYAAVAEFHYLHHDRGGAAYADPAEMAHRIVAAAGEAGIGLTLLPVHYQFGGCDGRALDGGQRRFGTDPDGFARLHDASRAALRTAPGDAVLGVAPHSLRAVSPDGLAAVLAATGGLGPVHMHLAEQVAEVDEVLAHRGARPAEWLLGAQDVDPRWCLIHCTQLNDHEVSGLAASGAVAGLCPLTESNLGDGIFRGTEYLPAGGAIGIGSDSNVQIALFEELKTLEYSQRLRDRSRAALAQPGRSTGRVLYEAVAAGGAQAAGRDAGRIAPGARADLLGLAADPRWLAGRSGDAALDTLIFAGAGGACVREVWSAGRLMVQDGQHVARATIVARAARVMSRLGDAL